MASLMKTMFLFTMAIASVQISMGSVYNVGDSDGWTAGGVDYKTWASSKTFRTGDTIVFDYDAQFHNVMQVSNSDYESCNPTAVAIATYTTGKDSVALKKAGDYFFVCGAPGHCDAGQKVAIKVVQSSSSSSSKPSKGSSAPASSPHPSKASSSAPASSPKPSKASSPKPSEASSSSSSSSAPTTSSPGSISVVSPPPTSNAAAMVGAPSMPLLLTICMAVVGGLVGLAHQY